MELFISNQHVGGQTLSVFHESNQDSGFNWIRVFPKTKYGAPARGTMVTVTLTDSSKRSVVIGADCSFMCQSEPLAHFGLGKEFASEMTMVWPGGHIKKMFLHLSDNNKVLIVEHSGSIRYIDTSWRGTVGQPSIANYFDLSLLLVLVCYSIYLLS